MQARIGVTTGEVVTGTEERLATGDAVNVAARLEQAAAPGEILIGEPDAELVRDAVEAEPVEPLVLKGKAEPVPAFRLGRFYAAPERSHGTRFVGRERELALVRASWERARSEARCELLTVVGEAGVGKSRLVAEALALDRLPRRRRPLPSLRRGHHLLAAGGGGEAAEASFPPILRRRRRSARCWARATTATSAEEIAWAFRKLLEEQAPLVVLFDDIQWADETFLDLVEAAALLTRDAPLLLLCMARPELIERRPSWPTADQARAARGRRGRASCCRQSFDRDLRDADRACRRRQPALPHRDGGDGTRG